MSLSDFYAGTTKTFRVTISLNDVAQDITADTVTFMLKEEKGDEDTDALIDVNADVATEGASGTAIFSLTPAETNVIVGKHYFDIVWYLDSGEEYVLLNGKVSVLERVSDL